jgi:hypothetical protein
MDESEKLIIQAALGHPVLAQRAWAKWKLNNPLSSASPVLSWAAGYIHNNLKVSGMTDAYLLGIYRHNLVSNNLRLNAALPVLTTLKESFGIIPLKSFSISTQEFSWGNRPVADFDFYSDSQNNEKIWELLYERDYKVLLDISETEFNSRILNYRGSWNFKNTKGIDLDLHWRIFDHLSLKENRDLIAQETISRKTQIGFEKFLSPELDLVILANHQHLQGEGRFNGIFDVFHQAKGIDENKLVKLLKQTKTQISMESTIEIIADILGGDNHPKLISLQKSLRPKNKLSFNPEISHVSRYFQKSDLQIINLEHRHPQIYKLWSFFGRHAFLEKLLLRQFGAFSKYIENPGLGFNFATEKNFGIGWHYQYPIDNWRWGHTPDSRIAWKIEQNKSLQVTIELNSKGWSLSPVQNVNVFFNGIYVGACTKQRSHFTWLFKSNLDFLEISFRPDQVIDYMATGPNFNWYRLSIPIMKVTIKEESSQLSPPR